MSAPNTIPTTAGVLCVGHRSLKGDCGTFTARPYVSSWPLSVTDIIPTAVHKHASLIMDRNRPILLTHGPLRVAPVTKQTRESPVYVARPTHHAACKAEHQSSTNRFGSNSQLFFFQILMTTFSVTTAAWYLVQQRHRTPTSWSSRKKYYRSIAFFASVWKY